MNILNEECNSEYYRNLSIDKKFSSSETDIRTENTNALNLLIKPCSVVLTRLNFCDYIKETLNDNTDNFLEQQPIVTTSHLIKKNKDETLKWATVAIDLTSEIPNMTDILETDNCVYTAVCKTFGGFQNSKEEQPNVTSHLINKIKGETLKCVLETIDSTDEIPDINESKDKTLKCTSETIDLTNEIPGVNESKDKTLKCTSKTVDLTYEIPDINESKDKTLKCTSETIDLTDEISGVNESKDKTLKCTSKTVDLTDEIPDINESKDKTLKCTSKTVDLTNEILDINESKDKTLKCTSKTVDLTDEILDINESKDKTFKCTSKTVDLTDEILDINESKDKTLKCTSKTVDLTDEIPDIADFPETENCVRKALCKACNEFPNSEEKELLNYKLHHGIHASNNFEESDGVLFTKQNQSVKTNKKIFCSSLNTFTNTDFKFSHASRSENYYKKILNKKSTEIKDRNNQPLEETYSKIVNKVQVNRDKNKNALNQISVNKINHVIGNKASTDRNWSLEDKKNVSFYSERNISSNCIKEAVGNNKQSFNSFPCSSHLNRISIYTRKNNKMVESTPNKFAMSGVRNNLKFSQNVLCDIKNDVPIKRNTSERYNVKIVKNVKPCSVVLSRLKPQAFGYITYNSSHLLQNEEKDKTSFNADNSRKNKISESSSNFIKCSVSSKKESDHDMVGIAEDIDKAFEDYISVRKKNNQSKKYEPRDNFPKIFRKNMFHCDQCCDLRKMTNKRLTLTEVFREHLAQLSSAKPLSKYEAISNTNFTSEKSLENCKQDSKLSEVIPDLKPCYVLIDRLSLSSLNGEESVRFSTNNIKTKMSRIINDKLCINEKVCLRNKGNYFNKNEMFVLSNAKEPNKNLFLNNEIQGNLKKGHKVKNKKYGITGNSILLNSKQSVKLSTILKENERTHNVSNTLPTYSLNDLMNKKYLKDCHVVLKRLNLKECSMKYNLNDAQQDSKNISESKDYANVRENTNLSEIVLASRKNENKRSFLNLNEKRTCCEKQRRLNILKHANSLKAFNNFSKLKFIEKLYRKRSKPNIGNKSKLVAKKAKILNFLKEFRNSKSLPCGSRSMNISGKAFRFHTMSVADVKETVSSQSVHNKKKRRFCTEDLQNTECKKSTEFKSQYHPKKGPSSLFNCVQCCKIFQTNEQYCNHLCAGKISVGYVCEICEEILKTATEYAVHVKDHFNL
ncbi:hypothetical protein TNCT_372151 [Trichonephila clavata]|uniref:C2H2-type domain-containing protein n=1 Tax=Trichonephila clavata TaxID=2740835 RepID=A0A8X6JDU9_TRICU|nr:hypothetical protein TNCT_372151 [Trichonephila clavata]